MCTIDLLAEFMPRSQLHIAGNHLENLACASRSQECSNFVFECSVGKLSCEYKYAFSRSIHCMLSPCVVVHHLHQYK